jgi:hypothetical protein
MMINTRGAFLMALQPSWTLAAFQSPDLFTVGRTPWTSDRLVARPPPKHMTTQTQNKHIYTPNIHALSGTGAHDHSVRASEVHDSATVTGCGAFGGMKIAGELKYSEEICPNTT